MNPGTATFNSSTSPAVEPKRVIPLLQALSRLEDCTSSLVMRLDPITSHVPQNDSKSSDSPSVTGRINQLGDVLQYLLDNIEL